jgi:hypothetical protein
MTWVNPENLYTLSLINSSLAYFPYFEKWNIVMRLRCCLCVCIHPIVARQRLGKKNPFIAARQRLGKKISLSLLGNGSVEMLPR